MKGRRAEPSAGPEFSLRAGGTRPKFAKFSGRPGWANAAATGCLFAPVAGPARGKFASGGLWTFKEGLGGGEPPLRGAGDEGTRRPGHKERAL